MASSEPSRERDRHRCSDVRAPEVVDVVVLGDDEALPLALRKRIDRAVELQQHRAALERQLGCVRVGNIDRTRCLAGRAMPELPAVRPCGDIRDDVDLLTGVLERALEREVVASRHDKRMGRPARSQHGCQRREETVHGLGLDRRFEAPVELVVQGPRAVHGRDVLRDARQVERALARIAEGRGELCREVGRAVEPEHRYEAAGEDRLHDLRVRVALARNRAPGEPRFVAEDRRLELLERLARLDPELVERDPRLAVGVQRVCLTPRAVEREHQQLAQPLPQRELADERLQLRDHVGGGAQLDFGRDPLLDGHGAELVEAPRLGLRPLLEGELGQRRAAPEVERAREQRAALPRGRDPCVGEHPLEAPGVELLC